MRNPINTREGWMNDHDYAAWVRVRLSMAREQALAAKIERDDAITEAILAGSHDVPIASSSGVPVETVVQRRAEIASGEHMARPQ